MASRATVGIGSVYNHFPTYEALVRACAAEVTLITQPPQASTFEGIEAPAERVRLLVRELFAYYDRYHWFELIRCDRHKLPVVAQAVQRREQARRELIREALRPLEPDEPTVTIVFALTDFAVHGALIADGISTAGAADQVAAVLLAWLRGGIGGSASLTGISGGDY